MQLIQAMLLALAVPQVPALETRLGGPTAHLWTEGDVYPLLAAPGQISSITLEPGEKLISVAAGDTAQWVIGDTTSGRDETRRAHVLLKPVSAGLKTNLVITTDRRTYQVALESRANAPLTTLRWSYASPEIIAVTARQEPACRAGPDMTSLNFHYRIEGHAVPWRPVRAFDDGRQTYIEFPPTFTHGEAPPLFVKGADGRLELVNYRVKGRFYLVDRLFSAAELRIGEKKQQKVLIIRQPVGERLSSRSGS